MPSDPRDSPDRIRELLSQLAHMLPTEPTVREVSERVVWLAGQIAWSDSIALFLSRDGRLEVEAFRSAHHEALTRRRGLRLTEPLVQRGFSTARAVRLAESDTRAARIFPDETSALALPIHDYGMLYLGRRTGEPYDDQTVTHLTALCQQAHLALLVARMSGSRAALEADEARARRNAENLLNSVSQVVDMMGEILALSEPEDVLETVGRNLFRVADFEFWAVAAGEWNEEGRPAYYKSGPAGRTDLDQDSIRALIQLCLKSGRTISLVNMERLTLPRPSEQIRSVLMCPMPADQKVVGCLMMGCVRPVISRHERELLSTVALQVGSHFWNLHLHRELKESQAQLVQSSKMAAVGQLAAGVAHEMNTPLGAINLAIEGSLRVLESKPDRARSRLERAMRSGQQLSEIVSKLLHYSKQTTSEAQETDLNTVVRDTLGLIGHQLRLENVEVRTELQELPTVLANQNELQQILVNLLTNARDAVVARDGPTREVVVATRPVEGKVEVSVQDWGTGMDAQTLARAFDPFYTTKEVGKGTGLGLSVTRELLESNNADLQVDSVPGEGTTMTVTFQKVL